MCSRHKFCRQTPVGEFCEYSWSNHFRNKSFQTYHQIWLLLFQNTFECPDINEMGISCGKDQKNLNWRKDYIKTNISKSQKWSYSIVQNNLFNQILGIYPFRTEISQTEGVILCISPINFCEAILHKQYIWPNVFTGTPPLSLLFAVHLKQYAIEP